MNNLHPSTFKGNAASANIAATLAITCSPIILQDSKKRKNSTHGLDKALVHLDTEQLSIPQHLNNREPQDPYDSCDIKKFPASTAKNEIRSKKIKTHDNAPQDIPLVMERSTSQRDTTSVNSASKIYVCTYQGCKKAYSKPSRLTEHERSHTDERPFKCLLKECSSSFRREAHLSIHMRSHSQIRAYKCFQEGCTKVYYTKDKLDRHLKKHVEIVVISAANSDTTRSNSPHSSSKGEIEIDQNGGRKVIKVELRDIHKIAATIVKEKPYACTWEGCIKRFTKHQQLKAHVCIDHEGRKPYPCTHEECRMSFQTPSKLRKHQLVHSDSRQYACGELGCDEVFSKWSLLQKHKKLCHKSSTCHICGKVMLKNNMKSHIKTHDTTRPIVPCTYEGCTKVYSTERTLATHIKTFHEKQQDSPRFSCEYDGCNMGFEFKHVLEKHVQRKHLDPRPKKKRSDAIVSTALDDLLGFTDEDAATKMPFACIVPGCRMRYSKEWLLRRHMKSSAHQAGEITGADLLQSMDEFENQAIRDMIDMNIRSDDINDTPVIGSN